MSPVVSWLQGPRKPSKGMFVREQSYLLGDKVMRVREQGCHLVDTSHTARWCGPGILRLRITSRPRELNLRRTIRIFEEQDNVPLFLFFYLTPPLMELSLLLNPMSTALINIMWPPVPNKLENLKNNFELFSRVNIDNIRVIWCLITDISFSDRIHNYAEHKINMSAKCRLMLSSWTKIYYSKWSLSLKLLPPRGRAAPPPYKSPPHPATQECWARPPKN